MTKKKEAIFQKRSKLTDEWEDVSLAELRKNLSQGAIRILKDMKGSFYNCGMNSYLRRKP